MPRKRTTDYRQLARARATPRAVHASRIMHEYYGGNQTTMAEALDLRPPSISRVVNGFSNLGVESCIRLANITQTDPWELLMLHGHDSFIADLKGLLPMICTQGEKHGARL